MNNIIDVLLESKKLTAREISEMLKLPPNIIIKCLLHLEREGKVEQLNGYWMVKQKETRIFIGINIHELLDKWGALNIKDISHLANASISETKKHINIFIDRNLIARGLDGKYHAL